MFIKQLKFIYRNIIRHKSFSAINIIGLSIGFATCIMIAQYVTFELSYDNFHDKPQNIFRVENHRFYPNRADKSAGCNYYVGEKITETFPEVTNFTRVVKSWNNVKYKDSHFKENKMLWAEPSFFEIFNFPLIKGDVSGLSQKATTVITEKIAKKYFGDEDPVGKLIEFNQTPFKVIAVAENIPQNTYLYWEILLAFPSRMGENYCYTCNGNNTYIRVKEGTDIETLDAKLKLVTAELHPNSEIQREYRLQPLRDIHLNSNLRFELQPRGDRDIIDIIIYSAIGLLLMAWLNYINLSTSRAIDRAKEVGVLKVIGADKKQLFGQFTLESLFINIISGFIGLLVATTFIKSFNSFTAIPISFNILNTFEFWAVFISIILAGSFLAGIYPSIIMASYKPAIVLKGFSSNKNSGATLRKFLTIFQFGLSIFLITATLVVSRQVDYFMNFNLGINLDNTLVVEFPGVFGKDPDYYGLRDAFINKIKQNNSIEDVSFATDVPGQESGNVRGGIRLEGQNKSEWKQVYSLWVSKNYFDVMDVELLCGTPFTDADRYNMYRYWNELEDSKKGFYRGVYINENALNAFGINNPEDAIGQKILLDDVEENIVMGVIKGVIKDFYQLSPENKTHPIIIHSAGWGNQFLVKLNGKNYRENLEYVEETYMKIFPGNTFNYFFLDEKFDSQFKGYSQAKTVFSVFAFLAMLISAIGLFGLTSFTIAKRTKEIGIRKVLGAGNANIVKLLLTNLFKLVIISSLISLPLTYMLSNEWLNSFANRINLSIGVLITPITLLILLTLISTGYSVLKVANSNPVDSIKYE